MFIKIQLSLNAAKKFHLASQLTLSRFCSGGFNSDFFYHEKNYLQGYFGYNLYKNELKPKRSKLVDHDNAI